MIVPMQTSPESVVQYLCLFPCAWFSYGASIHIGIFLWLRGGDVHVSEKSFKQPPPPPRHCLVDTLSKRQLQIIEEHLFQVENAMTVCRALVGELQGNSSWMNYEDAVDVYLNQSHFIDSLRNETRTLEDFVEQSKAREECVEFYALHLRMKALIGLFGWFFGSSTPWNVSQRSQKNESTILAHLIEPSQKSNRSDIEMESIVLSLHQNDIRYQLSSRDVAAELNDRITIFEAYKVVLKAALRQLKKELNEEAQRAAKPMKERLDEEEFKQLHLAADKIRVAACDKIRHQRSVQQSKANATVLGTFGSIASLKNELAHATERGKKEVASREGALPVLKQNFCNKSEEMAKLKQLLWQHQSDMSDFKELLKELTGAYQEVKRENRKLAKEKSIWLNLYHRGEESLKMQRKSIRAISAMRAEKKEVNLRVGQLELTIDTQKNEIATLQARLVGLLLGQMQNETVDEGWRIYGVPSELVSNYVSDQLRQYPLISRTPRPSSEIDEMTNSESVLLDQEVCPRTRTPADSASATKSRANEVRFRRLRKMLARATGIHGLLTPPSVPALCKSSACGADEKTQTGKTTDVKEPPALSIGPFRKVARVSNPSQRRRWNEL